MCLVACTWSVVSDQFRRGCALSPRQNVAIWFIMSPPASTCITACTCIHYHLHLHALSPEPACTTTFACSTHILFDLSMAMSGSGGYFASPAPAMSKVLPPVLVPGVVSSEVSSSLSISKETRAFILKNRDIIKPIFRSMMSSFCILIGCQGNSDAL